MESKQVLIETYWNVKSNAQQFFICPLVVLIETYWNVKLRGAYTNVLTDAVLIETYWNVKSATKLDGYQVYPWY